MPRRLRSRAAAFGIVAVVVALSVWLVLAARPSVHPSVTLQGSIDQTPHRMDSGSPVAVDVAEIAVPAARRFPIVGTSSFELWSIPAGLATLAALLLVFRRRTDGAPLPVAGLRRGATPPRAPPRLLHG